MKKEDLPEIVHSLDGGPAVKRLDTIDPALKELIYELLDTGVYLERAAARETLPQKILNELPRSKT